MSDSDKKDDSTRIGGGPPLPPKLPTPGAASPPGAAGGAPGGPAADTTHAGVAPPPLPKSTAAPPPAQKPPASPPPVQKPSPPPATGADPDETVAIGQTPQHTPFSLQHVQPPGHTSVVYLSRETYLLGRGHSADLVLFSPAASREHARLERRADGWFIEALEGKTVIANGSEVRAPVRLEHKMRLQLGGDELIFFDETAVVAAAVPASPAASTGRTWSGLWIAAAVGLAAAAAVLGWLLLSARG